MDVKTTLRTVVVDGDIAIVRGIGHIPFAAGTVDPEVGGTARTDIVELGIAVVRIG